MLSSETPPDPCSQRDLIGSICGIAAGVLNRPEPAVLADEQARGVTDIHAVSHCPKCDGLPRLLVRLPESNTNRVRIH
jgi:hypothetical protein